MSKRPPSSPPEIPGFQYLSVIGSGGFSDVFLYQQRRPRRRVALKVLLTEWSTPHQRAAFDAEADLMATLSNHPSIVTMYEASITPDGRPYLAMEYCSQPSLGARYRQDRLTVAEVLRVGVQISGAIETSHRAGILHRDIKPANILVTEYGHPVLADFGISSTIDDAGRAEGMSVPWSPPESFDDPPSNSVQTDVWALGATVFSLLARRTPFEMPGASNSSAALVARIRGHELLPTGRSDVPASLERVLRTSMSKSRANRYPSALEFARSLQQVQNELSLAVTPVDLLNDVMSDHDGDDDGGTQVRRFAGSAERQRHVVVTHTGAMSSPVGTAQQRSSTVRGDTAATRVAVPVMLGEAPMASVQLGGELPAVLGQSSSGNIQPLSHQQVPQQASVPMGPSTSWGIAAPRTPHAPAAALARSTSCQPLPPMGGAEPARSVNRRPDWLVTVIITGLAFVFAIVAAIMFWPDGDTDPASGDGGPTVSVSQFLAVSVLSRGPVDERTLRTRGSFEQSFLRQKAVGNTLRPNLCVVRGSL